MKILHHLQEGIEIGQSGLLKGEAGCHDRNIADLVAVGIAIDTF
jgi:hypothetical protein